MLNKNTVFCFTGKGPISRNEMTAIAIKAGASITKSITNTTTTLVIMDMNSTSTKARKARENGIELIGPQTFFQLCNINSASSYPKSQIEKKIIAEEIKKPLLRKIIL